MVTIQFRQRHLEAGRKQRRLRDNIGVVSGAQFINDGQQQNRQIVVARLQAVEIGGQHHDGVHQRPERLPAVSNLALFELVANDHHFLNNQCRTL